MAKIVIRKVITMVRIVFLGVGGWISNPYLNQSGIAIESNRGNIILLDVGEGICKYLNQHNIDISKIIGIFVSHNHGDHILGIPTLIQLLKHRSLKTRIVSSNIVINKVIELLNATSTKFDDVIEFISININQDLKLEEFKLRFTEVAHTIPTLAIRVDVDNICIVYSGDTTYTKNLVKLARNCDVLIHEVSGYDEMSHVYGHSTVYDAVRVAYEANVKMLILTHFYIDTPILKAQILKELGEKNIDLVLPHPGYVIEL